MSRRQAVVHLSQQELEWFLRLPAGLRIVGVRDDWVMHGVKILIEGEQLQEVPEGVEPIRINGAWKRNPSTGRADWVPPWLDGQ